MAEIDLKPCPFCGGEVFIPNVKLQKQETIFPTARMEVVCCGCGMGAVFGYGRKSVNIMTDDDVEKHIKETAEAWNRRADNG